MSKADSQVVKLFAGSNTGVGFHSFYDHVAGPEARRVFIIKGGPGIGKSTMMRRVGEALWEAGWPVEIFYCSSDTGSVDGIAAPGLGAAILDGTAPHIMEPTDPGAVGEVVNLGDYWDRSQISSRRESIRGINDRLSRLYRMSHDCLAAASRFRQVLVELTLRGGGVDTTKLRALGIRLAQEAASLNRQETRPWLATWNSGPRCLFASAITQEGTVNFLNSITGHLPHRHIVAGPVGSGKSILLKSIMQAALLLGMKMVVFRCSLDPDRVEHLVFPDRGMAFVTSAWPHLVDIKSGDKSTDTAQFIEPGLLSGIGESCRQFTDRIRTATGASVEFLAQAKDLHDLLESYYIPAVDFARVDKTGERIRDEILELAENRSGSEGSRQASG